MSGSPSFLDPNNTLLTNAQARLETGAIDTPAGRIGVATIRTATTTLTVMLGTEDADTWARVFTDLAARIKTRLDIPTIGETATISRNGNGVQP